MKFYVNYLTQDNNSRQINVTVKLASRENSVALGKLRAAEHGLALVHRGDKLLHAFRANERMTEQPTPTINTMLTNTKRNEHPACHCRQCRRGAGNAFGQLVHKYTNRAIRHMTKIALKKNSPEDFDPVIVGTPYTD